MGLFKNILKKSNDYVEENNTGLYDNLKTVRLRVSGVGYSYNDSSIAEMKSDAAYINENAERIIKEIGDIVYEGASNIEPILSNINAIKEECINDENKITIRDSEAYEYLNQQLNIMEKIELPDISKMKKPVAAIYTGKNGEEYNVDDVGMYFLAPMYAGVCAAVNADITEKMKKEIEQQLYGLKVGKEGEERIINTIKPFGFKYKILENVVLPSPDGGLAETDLVVVSEKGVFIIETKNKGKNTNKVLHCTGKLNLDTKMWDVVLQ